MADVKHRIGVGSHIPWEYGGDGNDIDYEPPVSTVDMLTADRTDLTADSKIRTADESYLFTADSTRFGASSTII